MGCRHLSRIDFLLDREGMPWLLEVNTLPGFTEGAIFVRNMRSDELRSGGMQSAVRGPIFDVSIEKIKSLTSLLCTASDRPLLLSF